jgi:hypothetical protein
MPSAFVFDYLSFEAFVNNPIGPIARRLSEEGDRIVVAAQGYVGTQWPGGPSSPPQPFRRSGELQATIRALEPLVIGGELQVILWADPTNERDGFAYAPWLRERGYQFVDLDAL